MHAIRKFSLGFTLIELVIVILIVAIISVIALPKFLKFDRDAQISQLEAIAASIHAQNQITYSKSAIANIEALEGCSFACGNHPYWDITQGEYFIDASGTRLYVSMGYPLPPLTSNATVNNNYRTVFGLPSSDYLFTSVTRHSSATAIVPIKWQEKLNQIKDGNFECHVEYSSPTSIRKYSVKAFTKDC
ncbi:prepilin-type N-terminal cleavage/methylation domain-containing protein [Shewanella fidelis]|uniref:Prepilin-type N-terminal cleavage/methylation domain-containing protein n=1 Tax=Shewanella fidelis TaxID=173509 RepID=A0AAW8NMI4_9GAMM|nr:prepilin-type N-terminal cleavage/methylation domain-containing protein [Shewanella fidelis]MDR8523917.1 prepilin-type N-terminal cleavage/methylation domain-containing protein [Shewanella fidelis]MDW4810464.1 prepilin-type N-terminal cleavage/methylation domain-containing protein [Shewanella fidelis]MDW4814585.1 prepilin-type N-terminal cleavage/methylation domain-containing protein [Shewanella fidelis]MDW4818675.1 prepilin-type N-terminal cleavage/methylation domain-containing protein [She